MPCPRVHSLVETELWSHLKQAAGKGAGCLADPRWAWPGQEQASAFDDASPSLPILKVLWV